jgi:sec-independent protein translocase protein TatB
MFDLGWQEFLLVAIITIIVVGPKDLPRVIRSVSQWVRKARSMAREFQSSLEEVAREAELDDVRREVQSISKDGSIREGMEDARKATGAEEIEGELRGIHASAKAADAAKPASGTAAPAIETAEDYAAATVTKSEPTPVHAAEAVRDDVVPTEKPKSAKKPKATAAGVSSGEA